MLATVVCAVRLLVPLSLVLTSEADRRFVDDLEVEGPGLGIHTRLKTHLCRDGEFKCKSGQCVESSVQCNGTAECDDKTDETAELCSSIICPAISYTCAYGGCVSINALCDGKKDCFDGSDEDNGIVCRKRRATDNLSSSPTGYHCILPPQPTNGRFTVGGCDYTNTSSICRGIEGTEVNSPAILNFMCETGYVLKGYAIVLCFGGKLRPEPPTCENVRCPPLDSTTVISTCKYNDQTVDCNSTPSPVGTEATLKCNLYYELNADPGYYDTLQCSSSGQWTPAPFACTPVCGIRNRIRALRSVDEAVTEDFPWMVAVYRNITGISQMTLICGGSLISDRLVVTAAHCFQDSNGEKAPKEMFKFAVGKYYNDWDTKENHLQVRDADDIIIPQQFQGRKLNYASDIAVILLSVPVGLNWRVRPICMDWKNEFEKEQFVPGTVGEVAGWGFTKEGFPSKVLRSLRLPFVDFNTCWNNVPESFQLFITTDKFCAGHTNGTSLCRGDTGGGLAFEHNGKWYLQGVASVGPAPENGEFCNTKYYTGFTAVPKFVRFIRDSSRVRSCDSSEFTCLNGKCVDNTKLCDSTWDCEDGSDEEAALCKRGVAVSTATSLESQCFLPGQPENGRFVIGGCVEGDASSICRATKGTPVQPWVSLVYSCDAGYTFDGLQVTQCRNGSFLPTPPTCKPVTCPTFESKSLDTICIVKGQEVDCNSRPLPVGTVATLACKLSYQLVNEPGYDTIKCTSSGQWKLPPYTCTPVCGTRNPDGEKYITYGEEAKVGEFPWVVAIYRNSTKTHKMNQTCGGTLVSDQVVVSAAHCFWDVTTHTQKHKELFKFAIGKYYRDWDTKERELQVRDAKEIIVHERYQDRLFNLANDIAVIVLDTPVQLKWPVRPICVDWQNKYERFHLAPNSYGVVAGWGYTEKGKPSTELVTVQLPFVNYKECFDKVPERFRPLLTNDKFCAGYTNGTSVHFGDSGSGLAFEMNNVWYLRGIVSVGASELKTPNQYTAFTSVSEFLEFIKKYYL